MRTRPIPMLCGAFMLTLLLALPAFAQELTVSAAASLTDAFDAAKAAFESKHEGVTIVINYGSSGALFRQIEQGAPVDVFAAANPKWMDRAEEAGLVEPKTRTDFARNTLVLTTPAENSAGIAKAADLLEDHVERIAMGTPETVPAGQYARESLVMLGYWDTLAFKYIYAENVRAVLDYLRRGEVDAGFVYRTDAMQGGEEVAIIEEMPLKNPVTYPIAIMKESGNKELAARFIDFLGSDEGMAILEEYGFSRP